MDADRIIALYEALKAKGTFNFDVFPTGMFPAVGQGSPTEATSGYRAAWVRDNVHVAYAHHVCGESSEAVRCVNAILGIYLSRPEWFADIISKRKTPDVPMNRPHIRFDGFSGSAVEEKWPHAQNDALGAFMWLLCRLVLDGVMPMNLRIWDFLAWMARYFESIRYWEDEDSGHWEETRKIAASSVGTVNAGLKECLKVARRYQRNNLEGVSVFAIEAMLQKGMSAMNRILPWECIQSDDKKKRRYDAALLFLVEPFNIVDDHMAERIIADVTENLEGEKGIRRYLLDSYWGPDYRTVPPEKRTIDLSEDVIQRDDYAVAGKEAQWCIFDSVISIYWGRVYRHSRAPGHLRDQIKYFNRAISQLIESDDGRLRLPPEAYFLENGRYVPNDHIPLQWAQANLWRAVCGIRDSFNMVK